MKVTIDQEKCTECGDCRYNCDGGCFYFYHGSIKFNGKDCIDCMACTEPGFCPKGAIEVEVTE